MSLMQTEALNVLSQYGHICTQEMPGEEHIQGAASQLD